MESQRIRLREFRLEDLPLYENWLAPGQEWQRWDGTDFDYGDPAWRNGHLDSLRDEIANGAGAEPRRRLVIADRVTDGLIGAVSRYWLRKQTHWLAIGIDIYDPSRWGRGVGFDALSLWCDHLFATLPELVRLDLRTWSGNERMVRLARRLGFTEEARFRDACLVDGKHFDALGYGVLREEWERRGKRQATGD